MLTEAVDAGSTRLPGDGLGPGQSLSRNAEVSAVLSHARAQRVEVKVWRDRAMLHSQTGADQTGEASGALGVPKQRGE